MSNPRLSPFALSDDDGARFLFLLVFFASVFELVLGFLGDPDKETFEGAKDMEDLRIRNFQFNDEEIEVKMDSYRREIRALDHQIIEMLGVSRIV